MALYLRATAALLTSLGRLPLIPKFLAPGLPGNCSAYNSFILLIRQRSLPNARLFVDVGANQDDFANAAGMCFPDARVRVVEPLPKM